MIVLDEIESDALAELANIGVSKASVALGRMVRGEVTMSVPAVEVVPRDEAARRLNDEYSGRLVAVSEGFSGALSGSAMLVFPEKNSLELVRAALPQDVELDHVFDLEQEALSEIGNILLNNCLAVMANMLGANLVTSLPQVHYGNGVEIFEAGGTAGGADATAIVFTIRFQVKDRDILGQIVIALDVQSAEALRASIGHYVARVLGQ